MTLGLHEILSFIAVAQLVLFSFFLITLKKGNRLSNRLLAFFLLSKSLSLANHLFFRLNIQNPHVYFVLVPFSFLWGPSLYFYLRSLLYKAFRFEKKHVVHLIPFILAWVYFMSVYHFRSAETKMEILSVIKHYFSVNQIIFVGILHILVASYMCASVLILWRYRASLKNFYSTLEEVDFSWLSIVLFGFIAIWIIDVIELILANIGSPQLYLRTAAFVLIFTFANIIVFKGLRQPEIFNGIEKRPKYQQSPLTREKKEEYLKRLQSYMRREKPYLNPGLSINKLAKRLIIPSRYLSQVVNESLGINFYDFVNSYRVEEAKNLLLDSSNNERNIHEIFFDSGFNTKSVFNRIFKKFTGMTPSEFKRMHPLWSIEKSDSS
jgi:AraC-like DNA-binding protein